MATAQSTSASPLTSASTPLQFTSLSEANSYRLKALIVRLSFIMSSESVRFDSSEFFNLCFNLARAVDFTLSINEPPSEYLLSRLPSLIKQVHERRKEPPLQPAIMILMIATKNACKNGWFVTADADELLNMTNELFSSFCMTMSVSHGVGNAQDIVSNLVSRYYPQFKMNSLINSFEVQPGYEILMSDFEVPKNYPSEEKIMLIVVQTDNLETSSCIVSPPQVSFLVNGKGLDGRTNVSPDSGPQFPTDITKLLKFGTNIIQSVGYFTGNFLIILAYMSQRPLCDPPILKDYIRPVYEVAGADSDIIEGASRISLNCPISFRRIKTPVKGHRCKHHQCFDYDNFIAMNSRKPSWRCPSCNQPVSFIDLRIDQDMVKILKGVEDVADVEISADGSWKAVIEENENKGRRNKENSVQGEHDSNIVKDTIDLMMIEEDGKSQSENHSSVVEDTKPFKNSVDFSEQIRNLMLSSTLPSTNAQDTRLNPMTIASGSFHALNQDSLPILEVTPLAEMRELPSQFGNSIVSHEAERLPVPRHVTRTPVAVQALAVPAPPTSSFKRMRVNGPSPSSDPLMTQEMRNLPATTPINSNFPIPSSATAANQATTSANTPISARSLSSLRSLIMSGTFNRANSTLPLEASRELARRIGQRKAHIQSHASSSGDPEPQVSRASNAVPSINVSSINVSEMPPLDKNWRPTGRMRGSLTGTAYSAALNQYATPTTTSTIPQANSSTASKDVQGNTCT